MGYSPQGRKRVRHDLVTKQQQHQKFLNIEDGGTKTHWKQMEEKHEQKIRPEDVKVPLNTQNSVQPHTRLKNAS